MTQPRAVDAPPSAVVTGAHDLRQQVSRQTRDALPLPGRGSTVQRFEALATVGSTDLCLAKLVEPHHDATAILAELAGPTVGPGSIWGVWAAEPPFAILHAVTDGGQWQLSGSKAFCSGAHLVTHALVTAAADDGPRLFAVDVAAARDDGSAVVTASDWTGVGMARADTRNLTFDGVNATAVGGPAAYVERPGFWHGAVGVAACWLGGARAVAATLERTAQQRDVGTHALAHLGAATAALDAATAQLHAVADDFDRDPADASRAARRRAESLRATVAAVVEQVIRGVGHALGPAPLAYDGDHARRVADLEVFVRQHHAERDLEALGRIVAAREDR